MSDDIASAIDNIQSSYDLSFKVTPSVTDRLQFRQGFNVPATWAGPSIVNAAD